MKGRQAGEIDDNIVVVSDVMVKAGISTLGRLYGEVSSAYLVREVFLVMMRERQDRFSATGHVVQKSKTTNRSQIDR